MNYLRVDKNRNNTIIDIAGDPFSDLGGHEFQVQSNYDFPTSQPVIFYRWNGDASLGSVEVNSEDTVLSIEETEGQVSGLDLIPHISGVNNSEYDPLGSGIIEVKGTNFSPFSVAEISGEGNFVNSLYFDSPNQIRIDVTAGSVEGTYNIIVKNDKLSSGESGYEKFVVKSKTTVDLRTMDPGLLGLKMTSGISTIQDASKGLSFTSSSASWNKGVKFGNYTWERDDRLTFDMVFCIDKDTTFMGGIISNAITIGSSISLPYYQQEIGFYHNNNKITTMYGGGDVENWSQGIGTIVYTEPGFFYKFSFHKNGEKGFECSLSTVDPDNWDDATLLHAWVSDCPADDYILSPFVIPQERDNGYYITGFRY